MFTTQCTGDIGIEVNGSVVAQAFIHLCPEWGLLDMTVHVYDLVRGGPHQVLEAGSALNLMVEIARREGLKFSEGATILA